ncbi:MAG: universal stress protein [Negativicutes bacterium]|nr:universal stress protein [Negativicutes bacterium]
MKKFAVLVDGSDPSMRAAKYTAELASAVGATVEIIHVMNLDSRLNAVSTLKSDYTPEVVLEESRAQGRQILEEAKALFPETIELYLRLVTGRPVEKALDFCQEMQPDLVIIGARGLGGIKGAVLGSISTALLENMKCPLLIIK